MPTTLIGVGLQLAALALFVCMDTLIKTLTARYTVPQLMFVRFGVGLIMAVVVLRLAYGSLPWRSRAPGLQALRSLCLAAANFLFSNALARVPLADATTVGFASPLITLALAAWWLGEAVSWRRWLGVVVGLVGVVVALRPPFLTGQEAPHWALLLPLGTAAIFGVYQILTRRLASIDDSRTTVLHTSLAAAVATALPQPWVWIWPAGWDWAMLAAVGVIGGGSHWLLVMAFARAPASLLAPMSYTQLIWATLASWWVFADVPDGWTVAGAAVIAAGGVLVALPNRRRN